ncbi:MAG: hypothetical protein V1689_09465, partial [Pseudomonadota bacterium]
MTGQAMEFTGIAPETGKSIKDWAQAKEKEWFGKEEDRGFIEDIAYEGSKMLGPSIIPGAILTKGFKVLAGLGKIVKAAKVADEIGDVAGATRLIGEATAIAKSAVNKGAAGAGAFFGLSQAQQTVDSAEETAKKYESQGNFAEAEKVRQAAKGITPYLTGTVEAVGETLGTKYLSKLLRLDEAGVVKRGAKNTVEDFLKSIGALGKTLGVEVGTEIGQAVGESGLEKVSGIRPEADPLKEALDVIGPTTFMTLLTGGMGVVVNRKKGEAAPDQGQVKKIIDGLSMGLADGAITLDDIQTMRGATSDLTVQRAIDQFMAGQKDQVRKDQLTKTVGEAIRATPEERAVIIPNLIQIMMQPEEAHIEGWNFPGSASERLVRAISGRFGKLRQEDPNIPLAKDIEDEEFAAWARRAANTIIPDEDIIKTKRSIEKVEEDEAMRQWQIQSQKSQATPTGLTGRIAPLMSPIPETPTITPEIPPEGPISPPGEKIVPERAGIEIPKVPAASAPVEGKAKEPWEMTQDEHIGRYFKPVAGGTEYLNKQRRGEVAALHRGLVVEALSEGKPVPQNIIDEYPDLAARHLISAKGIKGDTSISKSRLDGYASDTALFSDFSKSDTFRKKGLGGFDIPTQRLVLSRMFSSTQDSEIRDIVVQSIPVDVVDKLIGTKPSPDVSLHNSSMDKRPVIINADNGISLRVDIADTLVRSIARFGTEKGIRSSQSVRGTLQGKAAVSTSNADLLSIKKPPALAGTEEKTTLVLSDEGGFSEYGIPADMARKIGLGINVGHRIPPNEIVNRISRITGKSKSEVLKDYPDLAKAPTGETVRPIEEELDDLLPGSVPEKGVLNSDGKTYSSPKLTKEQARIFLENARKAGFVEKGSTEYPKGLSSHHIQKEVIPSGQKVEGTAKPDPWTFTDDQFKEGEWTEYPETVLMPSEYKSLLKNEGKEARDLVYKMNMAGIRTLDTHMTGDQVIVHLPPGHSKNDAQQAFIKETGATVKEHKLGDYVYVPVKQATPAPEGGKVEITETAKGTIVSTELTAKEENALTKKEQKAYLIAEIDKAIEVAPEELPEGAKIGQLPRIDTVMRETGNKEKVEARRAEVEAYIKTLDDNPNYVTIEVPGDGK